MSMFSKLVEWCRDHIRGSGNRHKEAPRVEVDWSNVMTDKTVPGAVIPMTQAEIRALMAPEIRPSNMTLAGIGRHAEAPSYAPTDRFIGRDQDRHSGPDPKMFHVEPQEPVILYRPFVNYKPQQQRVPPQCKPSPRATRTLAANTQARPRKRKASGSRR